MTIQNRLSPNVAPLIKSLQNQRVKNVAKLRDRRGREKRGCTIIEGRREILKALRADVELVEIFVCQQQFETGEFRQVIETAASAGAELIHVVQRVFEKISFGERSEGVLAVARTPRRRLDDLPAGQGALVAVLEGIEKPGNVGAILRSADGAGVRAVIVADGGTDLYNPNAIRASLGTIFSLPVCSAGARQAIEWIHQHQMQIVATDVAGPLDYDEADLKRPTAIVFGSEATGLSDAWTDNQIVRVRIPMLGAADSLNVASAAAILFYEALRQRRRA